MNQKTESSKLYAVYFGYLDCFVEQISEDIVTNLS